MKSVSFSGHLRISLRIVSLTIAALLFFGVTALLCAAVISRFRATPAVVTLAIVCGLIVWIFIAVFHFRREKVVLLYENREAFLQQLRAELSDLGYETGGNTQASCIYRPGFMTLLIGGSLRVDPADEHVTLTGPKICLENVRRRLRLNNHVQKARASSPTIILPRSVKTMRFEAE
jgi:hypothetical protein